MSTSSSPSASASKSGAPATTDDTSLSRTSDNSNKPSHEVPIESYFSTSPSDKPTSVLALDPSVSNPNMAVKEADVVITLPKEAWERDVAFGVAAWARFQAIVGSAMGKGRFMHRNSGRCKIVSRVMGREQCATRKFASAALARGRFSLWAGLSRIVPFGQE